MIKLLAEALKSAERAHKLKEALDGKPDADWPTFYAQWLIEHSNRWAGKDDTDV